MRKALVDLWQHRELLFLLTQRDIKIRYKQSVMGILWALLMPAIVVAAGVIVRIVITGGEKTSPTDISAVIVKSLPWAFFVASIRFATNSLTTNSNLVSKMAFPKEVFPIASVLACGFDFLVAVTAAIPVLFFATTHLNVESLWALPMLGILILFTAGLALLLSAGNLFFRDVKYIVEVILTFAIFFTPVLYDISMLGQYGHIALFNPVAPLLEGLRAVIVDGHAPQYGWVLYSFGVSLVVFVLGYWSFKRMEYLFAERV